jgi:hypothetical protein
MSEENLDQGTGNQDPATGGQAAADWKSTITDEGLKAHASLGKFKSNEDLFKSYVNLEKLVGKEKLPVPTDKDGKEIWDAVYARLGRPEDPKGYKLPDLQKPEGFPDYDPKDMEGLLSKAHELGLNNKQMGELYKTFMEGEISKYNQFSEEKAQGRINAETQLRKEWGKAYEEKMLKAKGVLNSMADDDIKQLTEEGLGNDPRFIKFLSNIAGKVSEDAIGGKPRGFAMSPEEAKSEIARIQGEAMANPKHPYINKEHPEHDMMVQKMNKLFNFATA